MSVSIPVKLVAGGEITLSRLTVEGLMGLQEQEYQVQRARLLEDLTASGAGEEIRVREFAGLQKDRDLGGSVVRSAFSPRGARQIIIAALASNGQTTTFEELDLDPTTTLWQLACDLLAIDWQKREKAEGDSSDPPEPSPETGISSPR